MDSRDRIESAPAPRRVAIVVFPNLQALDVVGPLEVLDAPLHRAHVVLQRCTPIEIGGGLGAFAGKAWRIGMMGSGCTEENALLCVAGISAALQEQGLPATGAEDAVRAAFA